MHSSNTGENYHNKHNYVVLNVFSIYVFYYSVSELGHRKCLMFTLLNDSLVNTPYTFASCFFSEPNGSLRVQFVFYFLCNMLWAMSRRPILFCRSKVKATATFPIFGLRKCSDQYYFLLLFMSSYMEIYIPVDC